MRLKIFFHDNCFDGATSAALFSGFYAARHMGAEIELQGVQHRRGDPFEGLAIDGDDNACVDFRFSPSPRMTWWFDHHVSAFQPPDLRAQFEADTSGQKFFDPTSPSCAMFLWRTLKDTFGYRPDDPSGHFADLVSWADLIDAARFPSPKMAVELAEPALQIMTWLEHNREPALTHRLIRAFGSASLADIAAEPWIQAPLVPLLEQHRRNIDLISRRAVEQGPVVVFDLGDDDVAAHNKFIAYMLFPGAVYTVGITQSADRCKISIGSNPWTPERRTHNIAELCERYGGGGHPVVGAISLPAGEIERTREIAREVVAVLSAG